MYERRDWGWKDREKHKEMMDYLSSLGKNSSVHVALPLFRFDVVCRDEVLYHYEVQMESKPAVDVALQLYTGISPPLPLPCWLPGDFTQGDHGFLMPPTKGVRKGTQRKSHIRSIAFDIY
ncbi:hypothetical protein EI555_011639 [Monodon monoceros]|uniref:Uncharacterized protein n=1 Tax=Monodon monoceros TaxID=40151 RepID=A0A4U1EG07_MONMO|nr:hypothetical protein EI555_011639 [Monodon monoceros]